MLSKEDAPEALRKLFRRRTVVDLAALFEVLGTRSRMTVFRRLREVGYHSSFTHTGRYYALSQIPQFDELGLWFFREVGFSRVGTLKETVATRVEETSEGCTHGELQRLLRVRAHNVLLDLFREGRVAREQLEEGLLYVSTNHERAAAQLARRREAARITAQAALTIEETVEVLVEALRGSPEIPTPAIVAERLAARGAKIEARRVQQVYHVYGLVAEKKTSGSGPSPP
jgi:hypothetical protein